MAWYLAVLDAYMRTSATQTDPLSLLYARSWDGASRAVSPVSVGGHPRALSRTTSYQWRVGAV